MNTVYIYNNSFTALISLIVELLKMHQQPGNIKNENYNKTLFDNIVYLKIENERKNIEQLKKCINSNIIRNIYYVFLSEEEDKELLIYNFIKYSIKLKNKVFFYRNIDCINKTIIITRRVANEAHKLKGFLRFKTTNNNFLYAKINPTNNIISILSNHFAKRLNNEVWIINDEKRKIYSIYYNHHIYYLNENDILYLNIKENNEELLFKDLWKTFHKTIAIKERKNYKCQRNFMPKKYWKNMLEMENEE